MPRTPSTPNTPITPGHIRDWNHFYSKWCEKRREQGLSCKARHASKDWKRLVEHKKAKRRIIRYEILKSSRVAKPRDDLDEGEEEVLANNTASLNVPPIKPEEQFPASPLFSECMSTNRSSPFHELDIASSSTSDQTPPAGPSSIAYELPLPGSPHIIEISAPGPPFKMDQPPFTAPPSDVEESAAASPSSVSLHAPIPVHPIPEFRLQDYTGPSPLDDTAYNYLDSVPTSAQVFPEDNLWDSFFGESSSSAISGINGSFPSTAVPATPITGYQPLGLVAPEYTQGLQGGLDDYLFAFNREQPMWTFNEGFEYCDPLSLAPPVPFFPFTTPAPAPTLVPAPALAPVFMSRFDQTTRFPADPHPWNGTAQMFESGQPQAAFPPVPQQDFSFAAIQQSINAANPGFKVAGVHIWVTRDT